MLEHGSRAPDFSLTGDDGKTHTLADYAGRKLILYFYPKDSTSGWTTEAREFSALHQQFADNNAVIVGVSPDSIASHQRFKEKEHITFLLLSDPEKTLATAYGAYGEKKLYGKTSMGIIRSTFIIEDGVVQKIWTKVRAAGHAEAVLQTLFWLYL